MKLLVLCSTVCFAIGVTPVVAQDLASSAVTADNMQYEAPLPVLNLEEEDETRRGSHDKRMHAFYMELLGNGLTYSFNYDFRFYETDRGAGARVGLSGFAVGNTSMFTLPIMFNYLIGEDNNYLELGIGGVLVAGSAEFLDEVPRQGAIGTMTFGYRYQPTGKGIMYRAAITPIFGSILEQPFFIPYWVGFGIGYAFDSVHD